MLPGTKGISHPTGARDVPCKNVSCTGLGAGGGFPLATGGPGFEDAAHDAHA
jgi:hypothetical protein